MIDVLVFVAFFALILLSGVAATNLYCRLAYKRCPSCRSYNVRRRSECRKCGTVLA